MTIKELQSAMIAAMKSGDKFRKGVISTVIARVKNSAIDQGCRDDIPESIVDAELLKAKKMFLKKLEISCWKKKQSIKKSLKCYIMAQQLKKLSAQ